MLYVITIIGLLIGNFLYEGVIGPLLFNRKPNWGEAFKISFMQAAAIATLYFTIWVCHRNL